jgi:hypothetical protein
MPLGGQPVGGRGRANRAGHPMEVVDYRRSGTLNLVLGSAFRKLCPCII